MLCKSRRHTKKNQLHSSNHSPWTMHQYQALLNEPCPLASGNEDHASSLHTMSPPPSVAYIQRRVASLKDVNKLHRAAKTTAFRDLLHIFLPQASSKAWQLRRCLAAQSVGMNCSYLNESLRRKKDLYSAAEAVIQMELDHE